MNILWIINYPIPEISKQLFLQPVYSSGWILGYLDSLKKNKDIKINLCFPLIGSGKKIITGSINNINYYGFFVRKKFFFLPIYDETKINKSTFDQVNEIIIEEDPDIIHIFGTEFPHSYLATLAFNKPQKTIVSIQGLVSYISYHFLGNLPDNVQRKFSISNIIRGNLLQQKQNLYKRGQNELKTINNVAHVIGRTTWDKACSYQINPNIKYHHCNETLREIFYKKSWDIRSCKKFAIFLSQSSSPIKGIHNLFDALPEVIKNFPLTHVYISGNNPTNDFGISNILKISSYGKFLNEKIKKNKLSKHITFLGNLDEENMCNQFLDAHVFVSTSSIENSPNSLGEAMILGVPTVASDVGGVRDLFSHNVDGFTYQHDAFYMLSYYICSIFSDDDLAIKFSTNSKLHANETHNKINNREQLIKIYERVYLSDE